MMIFNSTPNQRFLSMVFGLLLAIFLLPGSTSGQNKAASTQLTNPAGPETVSWNIADPKAPLLVAPGLSYSSLDSRLAYPGNDFAFPLFQILYYESGCDCFALMVLPPKSTRLQILHLQRLSDNKYRSVNGPVVQLEDSNSIKVVTSANKTSFLFAQVGDQEWRCSAIHDQYGNYLLIDYRPDGLIARVRDSFSRSVVLNYHEGRVSFLAQMLKEVRVAAPLEAK